MLSLAARRYPHVKDCTKRRWGIVHAEIRKRARSVHGALALRFTAFMFAIRLALAKSYLARLALFHIPVWLSCFVSPVPGSKDSSSSNPAK
jgi:hypothetical protein